jgi:serine phosphatase RsbU (regulator of sigma subunit)
VTLEPTDALVLYTDGVTEARQGDDFFGVERLEEALVVAAGAPASHVVAVVQDAVEAFQGGALKDDVALLVIRAAGDREARPASRPAATASGA